MIREAELDDVPRLVDLGADFLTNGDYWGDRRALDPVGFAHHLIRLVRSPDAGFFVIDNNGEVAGAIAIIIIPDIFTGERIAWKLHWLADKDKPSSGLKLEKRAREWAAGQGATKIKFSAVNDNVAQLLEGLGYGRVEVIFSKAI